MAMKGFQPGAFQQGFQQLAVDIYGAFDGETLVGEMLATGEAYIDIQLDGIIIPEPKPRRLVFGASSADLGVGEAKAVGWAELKGESLNQAKIGHFEAVGKIGVQGRVAAVLPYHVAASSGLVDNTVPEGEELMLLLLAA